MHHGAYGNVELESSFLSDVSTIIERVLGILAWPPLCVCVCVSGIGLGGPLKRNEYKDLPRKSCPSRSTMCRKEAVRSGGLGVVTVCRNNVLEIFYLNF